jgi:hypothetical protein
MPEQVAAPATPAETVASAANETSVTSEQAQQSVADAAAQEESTLLGQEEKKEEKQEGIAPPPKIVPEKYEFKAPEGTTLAPEAIESFTPIFKELGLDQAGAQKLIDSAAPYIQTQVKTAVEASQQESLKVFQDMVKEWGDQSKKELGADYQKKLAVVSKVIDKSGVKDLREMLNQTGVGNHPTMIKFMSWVGEQFSQDTLADSGKKISDDPSAVAKKMFPTMTQ